MGQNKIINELITDSIKKVKSQVENNEKVLTDKHNTLNWILTLTTILFAFFYSREEPPISSCSELLIDFIHKIMFVLMIISFLSYKILHSMFLNSQIRLYSSLNTHNLELKYNINKLKELYDFKEIGDAPGVFSVVKFINSFTAADFRFYKEHDTRDKDFKLLYDRTNLISKTLKIVYIIIFIMFSIYTLLAIIMIFK